MSRNVVTRGLGGPLVVSEGYGRHGGTVEVVDGPGAIIADHQDHIESLFITQFRQTRDLFADLVLVLEAAPTHTETELPVSGEPLIDMTEDFKSLFLTQFRRTYA